MCEHHHVINPVHCFLPPYIIDKLQESDNPKLQELALNTKFNDNRLMADREFIAALSPRERAILLGEPQETPQQQRKPKMLRRVYDARNGSELPGEILLREGEHPCGDHSANNVYQAAGHTWSFYYELFGRNSINNAGQIIKQTVNFGNRYANAFWNGKQMVYGNGDGEVFGDFTKDIEVIGHELTHGVIQYESNFEYRFQSGALNESFADVFGVLVKQKALNQDVNQADWLMGTSILLGGTYALRSMKAPGTAYQNHPVLGSDPQPGHMKDYLNLREWQDYGGVHINSGIPNFAFYVVAREIGGFAWEKAGRIWYESLADKQSLNAKAQFADVKEVTTKTAVRLYGAGSLEHKAVIKGWEEAGVI